MKQIWVKIDEENLAKIKNRKGFLDQENYPPFHEENSEPGEVGSWMDIRFILEK